ncbi:hypothetical protein PR048_025949 [Dryococelus australis]|uniref:Uncharacterized protein n=1 Tax=Dryococelus australis TaxID=614101 RepID=A0ABQ9GJZ2_9NEOP|nr:hypothetical protein PR048_025949 [Dryococelus australis]
MKRTNRQHFGCPVELSYLRCCCRRLRENIEWRVNSPTCKRLRRDYYSAQIARRRDQFEKTRSDLRSCMPLHRSLRNNTSCHCLQQLSVCLSEVLCRQPILRFALTGLTAKAGYVILELRFSIRVINTNRRSAHCRPLQHTRMSRNLKAGISRCCVFRGKHEAEFTKGVGEEGFVALPAAGIGGEVAPDFIKVFIVGIYCRREFNRTGMTFSLFASHQGEPGSTPDFREWESCQTIPLVGGFSRGSPVFTALSCRSRSTLTSITLVGSQDLSVKSRSNFFTHSRTSRFPCVVLKGMRFAVGFLFDVATFKLCTPFPEMFQLPKHTSLDIFRESVYNEKGNGPFNRELHIAQEMKGKNSRNLRASALIRTTLAPGCRAICSLEPFPPTLEHKPLSCGVQCDDRKGGFDYNAFKGAVNSSDFTLITIFPLNSIRLSGSNAQPGWNGFVNIISGRKEKYDSTYVMAVPFINMDVNNTYTIFAALCFTAEQNRKQNQSCIATLDQPLLLKASEIVASVERGSEIANMVATLGGFHLLMSFTCSVGQIMEVSGLKCLWAIVYAKNTVQNVFSDHSYTR